MQKTHKKYLKKRRKIHEQMVEMRKNGESLQKIADVFGVSRQRVHQVMQKYSK